MASLVFNHNTYYAVFSIGGKKIWKKIGKVDKKVAKQILKKLEMEFEQERVGLREIKSIAFSELAPLYLEYSKANKAYNSWQRDITSLKALSSYFGNMLLDQFPNECMAKPQ